MYLQSASQLTNVKQIQFYAICLRQLHSKVLKYHRWDLVFYIISSRLKQKMLKRNMQS